MEVLINELSLNGQFENENHFEEEGLMPFAAVLKELKNNNADVFKTYDLYSYNITATQSLHGYLTTAQTSRISDATKRIKSLLTSFVLDEPYWENTQKHSSDDIFLLDKENVVGFSLAEACERDKIVISFKSDDFKQKKILINKDNKEEIRIDNLTDKGHYNEVNWERSNIDISDYCINRFKGDKLDFSQIDGKLGFKLLKKDDEELFVDVFRKFTELTWQQIGVDDGLDYKQYPDNENVFKSVDHKIHKFRISQKYRCFGYVANGVFYVLRFDLEHKLSD